MPISRIAKILDAVKHERSDFTRLMLIHTQCFGIISEPPQIFQRAFYAYLVRILW